MPLDYEICIEKNVEIVNNIVTLVGKIKECEEKKIEVEKIKIQEKYPQIDPDNVQKNIEIFDNFTRLLEM